MDCLNLQVDHTILQIHTENVNGKSVLPFTIFLKKSLFCHRTFIWKQWFNPIFQKLSGNRWCLVSCICHDHFWFKTFHLFIDCLKCSAVMFISRMNTISKDPSVFITCRFYCICKNMFMFSFAKPSAFWICNYSGSVVKTKI